MTLSDLADWATANDLRSEVGPTTPTLLMMWFVGATLENPSLLIYHFVETTDEYDMSSVATISEEGSNFVLRT
jgi:hypothetical protein